MGSLLNSETKFRRLNVDHKSAKQKEKMAFQFT